MDMRTTANAVSRAFGRVFGLAPRLVGLADLFTAETTAAGVAGSTPSTH
jgi:hypothetical protein